MSLVLPHMDFGDDQKALVEAACDFAREELLPLDRRCDEDEAAITGVLPKLGEMGLLSLLVPQDCGGMGCAYTTYVAILHEIARYSPSSCVTIAVHSLVGSVLHHSASEPKRTEWLSAWGQPHSFAAFALSEAGAGSDAAAVKATAVKVKGGYHINGEKMWITNGMTAKWLLTLARLKGAQDDGALCALLVDGDEPGVERSKIQGKMGIRGSETAVISYNNVFVPEEHLLGEPGRGLHVFVSSLNRGRLGIAAQATGIAEACLSEMVAYAKQREQFGRPIGSFQAVAGMIADSAVELQAAKLLVLRGACKIDAGQACRKSISMAKLYATEAANRIAYRAVQVHGASGYVRECRVEQLYRDARVTTIYEGTSEIQRLVIARELAKQ